MKRFGKIDNEKSSELIWAHKSQSLFCVQTYSICESFLWQEILRYAENFAPVALHWMDRHLIAMAPNLKELLPEELHSESDTSIAVRKPFALVHVLAFESVTLHGRSLGKRMINYNKLMCFSLRICWPVILTSAGFMPLVRHQSSILFVNMFNRRSWRFSLSRATSTRNII